MIEVEDIIYIDDGTRKGFAIVLEICNEYFKVNFIGAWGETSAGSVPVFAVKRVWKNDNTVSRMLCKIGEHVFNHGFSGKSTSPKCKYCGKIYQRKKKSQRFCSIKCKDRWWNRERSAEREYLHPHCEDNFNGEW